MCFTIHNIICKRYLKTKTYKMPKFKKVEVSGPDTDSWRITFLRLEKKLK